MRLEVVLLSLPDDPELREQASAGVPPQFLTLDGVRRTRGRHLAVREAVAYGERGRPVVVLTFGVCVHLPAERLPEVLADPLYQGCATVGEADVRMFGHHRRGQPDTRLVVVSLATPIEPGEASSSLVTTSSG